MTNKALKVQPLTDPLTYYNWFFLPPHCMHFTLEDAKYCVGLTKTILSATINIEGSIQAQPYCVDDENMAFADILKGLKPALNAHYHLVAVSMDAATPDLWLDKSIQIPRRHLQKLCHATMFGMRNLFQAPFVDEVKT